MTRSRYRFLGNDAPYFLTMTINNWLPVFTRPETVEVVFESWRYLQTHHELRLYGYVILENHLHLIARSPALDKDVQRFKSYTAKGLIAVLEAGHARRSLAMLRLFKAPHKVESTYQVWEEGSHPPAHRGRGGHEAEARLHPPQPGEARVRRPAGALALVKRAKLPGAIGAGSRR
jgi:putative transposase